MYGTLAYTSKIPVFNALAQLTLALALYVAHPEIRDHIVRLPTTASLYALRLALEHVYMAFVVLYCLAHPTPLTSRGTLAFPSYREFEIASRVRMLVRRAHACVLYAAAVTSQFEFCQHSRAALPCFTASHTNTPTPPRPFPPYAANHVTRFRFCRHQLVSWLRRPSYRSGA